jgi:hypothetical protein
MHLGAEHGQDQGEDHHQVELPPELEMNRSEQRVKVFCMDADQ